MFMPVKCVYAFRKRIGVPFLASSLREMRQDRREKRCPRHAFEPLVGLLGVSGLGPDEKGGALLSIAAPSMPCEANRPLTSHTERNHGQTMGTYYPAFRRQRVLLRGQSAAWEVVGNFSGGG